MGKPYRVVIRAPLTDISADVHLELQARIHELARTIGNVPAHHTAFWTSVGRGSHRLDMKGWRFLYRIDPDERTVTIEQALFNSE
jgi:hypothetical protein